MRDYDNYNQMQIWQKQLDDADIDYDVSNLSGCTYREIQGTVTSLLNRKKKQNSEGAENE